MADRHESEFAGLSEEQKATMRRVEDAIEDSADFVRPYWDKALRQVNLSNGKLPKELDATNTKLMTNTAFSTVQNEIPRLVASLMSQKEFFHLEAEDFQLEQHAAAATEWLNFMVRKKNRIWPNMLPTMQWAATVGNGYRAVTHMAVPKTWTTRQAKGTIGSHPFGFHTVENVKTELKIVAQNVSYWSIMPSRNGGTINGFDQTMESAIEWLNWIDYKTSSKLKGFQGKKGFLSDQIAKMIGGPGTDAQSDPHAVDLIYKSDDELSRNDGDSNQSPTSIELNNAQRNGSMGRYRTIWTFFRDKWVLTGYANNRRYLLFDSPPLLDWFPIANYKHTMDFDNFFGIGMIEKVEDVILGQLLNFNLRLDYLAQTMHPDTWIRDDLLKKNPAQDLDPSPYGVHTFPAKVKDIQQALWRDRFPEISQQAFLEDTFFKQILQEVTAQPNYTKGLGGAGTLANETASGILALIEEGTAQSTLRALTLEYTGMQDELMLFLKYGKKYIARKQTIRRIASDQGFPWRDIDPDVITDGYGIELDGTRQLLHKQEIVKRIITVLPMLLQNPAVPGQREMLRQSLNTMDIFQDVESILGPASPGLLAQGALQGAAQQGGGLDVTAGLGGASTVTNQAQSLDNALPAASLAV